MGEKEREEAKEKARLDAEYKEKVEKLNRMDEKRRQVEREVEEKRKKAYVPPSRRDSPLSVQDNAGTNIETPEKSSSQGISKWQKGGNVPQSPGPSRGDKWRQRDREVEKTYRSFDRQSSQERGKLETNVDAQERNRCLVENKWQKGGNGPQSPAPSRVVDEWRQRGKEEEEKPKQAYVPPFMRKMDNQSRNRLSSQERVK